MCTPRVVTMMGFNQAVKENLHENNSKVVTTRRPSGRVPPLHARDIVKLQGRFS